MDKPGVDTPRPFRFKGPKLYHKKSRNGCHRCRSRKVKCDENRPVCGSCTRHNVSCTYDDGFRHTFPQRHDSSVNKSSTDSLSTLYRERESHLKSIHEPIPEIDPSISSLPIDTLNPPESAGRRLLELRLLHHYLTQTCVTFPGAQNTAVRDVWTISVPQIANTHPSLLYALLSISALHMSKLQPRDAQLQTAYRTYYVLALQNHRFAINKLDDANSADATCLTCSLIFINAYAALQDRVTGEPYEPPMQWLQIFNGARNIYHIALQSVQHDPTAVMHVITKSMPAIADTVALFSTANGAEFSNLLLPIKTGNTGNDLKDKFELQDEETREAYANTITYLGSVHQAIKRKEHAQEICRWLIAFAVIVPKKMIWLIEARRPRAFVILAHYFALVGAREGAMEAVWWIGRIAKREIELIQRHLPEAWQHLMSWPLAMTSKADTVDD